MKSVSTARRYAGLAGAVVGVVATAAAARVLADRRHPSQPSMSESTEPLGSLRGDTHIVTADDGVGLHAEVDEREDWTGGSQPSSAADPAADDAPLTIVFTHAYALNLDCWHFQRSALRGRHRLVFYDQRSHGKSGRSDSEHSTIDYTGRDLAAVINQLVPEGPVLLVGHSMGGMTILALADQQPTLFSDRVVGVALIATTAEGLTPETMGLPGLPGRIIHRLTPPLVATLAKTPRLVESGRRATSDIGLMVTRRLAFGGPVPQEWVDFTDNMLAATPFEVVADFFPGFGSYDKRDALLMLRTVPSVVVCGSSDSITPLSYSRNLAEALGTGEVVELSNAGHMVILERHTEVTQAIERLIDRVTVPAAESTPGRQTARPSPQVRTEARVQTGDGEGT
ncbi:MAG: alpha/beta hydrolase [Nocardioidaceae bacterium]|nr:alpha/beta hydrolase [Nocardioidaceae bacterium]